jgi:hypothetical protein
MDYQDDLAGRLVNVRDDVRDQGADKPLARAHAGAWRIPGHGKVSGKTGEVRRLGGSIRHLPGIEPCLTGLNPAQG